MGQAQDSLEDWYSTNAARYGRRKANAMRSPLTAAKSRTRYNNLKRSLPGSVFTAQRQTARSEGQQSKDRKYTFAETGPRTRNWRTQKDVRSFKVTGDLFSSRKGEAPIHLHLNASRLKEEYLRGTIDGQQPTKPINKRVQAGPQRTACPHAGHTLASAGRYCPESSGHKGD